MKKTKLTRGWKLILVVCAGFYLFSIAIIFFLLTQVSTIYVNLQAEKFTEVKQELQVALALPADEQSAALADVQANNHVEFSIYNNTDKALVFGTLPITDAKLLEHALNQNVVTNQGFYSEKNNDTDYIVWISQYYISPQEVFDVWIILLIASIALLFLIVTVIIGVVAYRLLRPMRRLQDNIHKISSYQLEQVKNNQRMSEYDALSYELSNFAHDLQHRIDSAEVTYTALERELQAKNELMDYRAKILATLAHDLKTPLHTAQLQIEKSESNDEHVLAAYNKIDGTIQEINNIVRIVYQDDISQIQQPEQFDLIDLFSETYSLFREQMNEKQFERELDFDEQIVIYANKLSFKQLIHNAISNICAYAPVGARVLLSCYIEDGQLIMSFYNDAKAISEEDRANIFNLFHRISHDKTGTGTGLYTIKSIAREYDGVVTFDNKDTGVILTITFLLKNIQQ